MTSNNLHAFNLNGSYAAINALNSENFPVSAKMHGDFSIFRNEKPAGAVKGK